MILPLLNLFLGKQIIDCYDQIEAIAKSKGYSVNVMDPTVNNSNIDVNYQRLNVHVDDDSKIISFSVG